MHLVARADQIFHCMQFTINNIGQLSGFPAEETRDWYLKIKLDGHISLFIPQMSVGINHGKWIIRLGENDYYVCDEVEFSQTWLSLGQVSECTTTKPRELGNQGINYGQAAQHIMESLGLEPPCH